VGCNFSFGGEGRATLARPFSFLCVGLICVALGAPGLAQAALPEVVLVETNPPSPGTLSQPFIRGGIDEGGGTKVVTMGLGAALSGPFARAPEPDNLVTVHTDSNCLSTPVAEGTVAELEAGEVRVSEPLADDSTTTFYGRQSNGSDESGCSASGLVYRLVSTPPTAPTFSATSPSSPANNNSPYLIGTADPEATVSIYTDSECKGSVVQSGSGAVFAAPGLPVSVADNSVTTFYAKATLAGLFSNCSTSSITYVEETPPPPPSEPEEEGGGEGGEEPVESGGGGGGGAPGGGAAAGGSATGGGASASAPSVSPAQVVAPPAPRIHVLPGLTANDTTPVVTGSASGASSVRVYASADCSGQPVARGPASELASPGFQVQVVKNVAVAFSAIAAVDGAQSGCSDPVAYVEDSRAPHVRITMGPAAKTRRHKVVLRFKDATGSGLPGTVFKCKVNHRKWRKCSSPLRLKHLKRNRRYLVKVKAWDPAGNRTRKPAKRRFRVI
jgi:hypothetical protein